MPATSSPKNLMTVRDGKDLSERKTKPTFIRWIKKRFALRKAADRKVVKGPRYDVFISYARKDEEFVFRLEKAFDQNNKNYWIDRKDIRHTEEWLDAIYSGIEAADNFIFILTGFSVTSENCAKELGHAIKHRKRLIPVLHEDVDSVSVPLKLAELEWISFSQTDDFDACIGKLIDAINTDLEHVRMHTQVLTRAIEWHAGFRPRSLLLRGGTLRRVERWLSKSHGKKQPEPTPLQVEYIRTSRKATWIRLTLVCATALALVAMLWFAQEQSNQAKSRRLAIESSNTLSNDPELSLLLAAEAWSAFHTQEAENAVRQALNESRIRATIREYTQAVHQVAFSPDGQYILTMNGNKALLSEAATGKKVSEYLGHSEALRSATFSRDGRLIVTTSADKTARVYDTATGTTVSVLNADGPNGFYSGDFSPDGRLVMTVGTNKTAIVWDAHKGDKLQILKWYPDVNKFNPAQNAIARFNRDGSLAVIAGYGDSAAHVWDTLTWQQVADLDGPGRLASLDFSPNGRQILIGYYLPSNETAGIVWEARTGKRLYELRGGVGGADSPQSVAYSPDGELVVSACFDETARLWNAHSGELVSVLRGHADDLKSASFSPDGRFVITSSRDKTARVWDTRLGTLVSVIRGHSDEINSAVFSPDGTLVVTASTDNTVRVWEANLHTKVLPTDKLGSLSPDLKFAATTSLQHRLQVWDIDAEQIRCESQGFLDHEPIFDPNGQLIASEFDYPRVVKIWDARTCQFLAEMKGHEDVINGLEFSKDGKLLITQSFDKTARIWEVGTGRLLRILRGHNGYIDTATFSHDGKLVVTASHDNTAQVWDVATGNRISILNHTNPPKTVNFSPDDKFIVTVSETHAFIKVWTPTGGTVAELTGHYGWVHIAFSSDGALMATGGYDGSLRVWELRTGRNMLTLAAHLTEIWSIEFSSDGKAILTAGKDEIVSVWDAGTGGKILRMTVPAVNRASFNPRNDGSIVTLSLRDIAVIKSHTCVACIRVDDLFRLSCDHLTRNLSRSEWKFYMKNDVYRKTCEQLP